jgi:hypothetical protein
MYGAVSDGLIIFFLTKYPDFRMSLINKTNTKKKLELLSYNEYYITCVYISFVFGGQLCLNLLKIKQMLRQR